MDIIIESKSPRGIIFKDSYSLLLKDSNDGINEIQRGVELDNLSTQEKLIALHEAFIYYINLNSSIRAEINVTKQQPAVKMMFAVSANILYTIDDALKTINLNRNQHNILFYPSFSAVNEWAPGNGQEFIQILLSPRFFEKYLPLRKAFDHFTKTIEKGKMGLLSKHHLPITPQMLAVLQQIIHNSRTGMFKRMLIEANILELLMLQLEQYEDVFDHPVCSNLRKTDIDRMHEARDIITANLANPCTLIDLAHQIGTNEYNLKKSFKEVFGTTVFGYLNQVRMEKAKEMLLSEQYNVNQVAELMGYNDATNFTIAFKRHFGILPSKLLSKKKK